MSKLSLYFMDEVALIDFPKDFQSLKAFNYTDYLITNPIQRILIRKVYRIKDIYNYEILNKYTNEDNKIILSQILLDFLNLALRALKNIQLKNMINF